MELVDHLLVDLGIFDDPAALICGGFPSFELGFDQGENVPLGFEQNGGGGKHFAERYERAVDDDQIGTGEGFWELVSVQVPGIDPFHDDHAGILAEFPSQLPFADVDGVDLGRTLLE